LTDGARRGGDGASSSLAASVALIREIAAPALILPAAAAGLVLFSWGQWDLGYTPWMQAEFGFSESVCGFFFAIPPLVYSLCTLPAGMLGDRFPKSRIIAAGLATSGAAFIVAAGWLAPWWPWTPVMEAGVHSEPPAQDVSDIQEDESTYAALDNVASWTVRLAMQVAGGVLIGVGGPAIIVPALPLMHEVASRLRRGARCSRPAPTLGAVEWEHGVCPATGREYWFNKVTEESTWEKPDPEEGSSSRERNGGRRKEDADTDAEGAEEGEKDDEEMTNVVSALFTFVMNVGGFLGPLIGTVLIDRADFRGASAVTGLTMMGFGFVVLCHERSQSLGELSVPTARPGPGSLDDEREGSLRAPEGAVRSAPLGLSLLTADGDSGIFPDLAALDVGVRVRRGSSLVGEGGYSRLATGSVDL
jgi:MFS family permease